MKVSKEEILSYLTLRNAFLLFTAFVVYNTVSQIVYYRFFHPLRKFPGPFWASVTRLWLGWHCWRQDELDIIYQLHEKYGSLSIVPSIETLYAHLYPRACSPHHTNPALGQRLYQTPRDISPPSEQERPLCDRNIWKGGVVVQHQTAQSPRSLAQDCRRAIQLQQYQENGAYDRRAHGGVGGIHQVTVRQDG